MGGSSRQGWVGVQGSASVQAASGGAPARRWAAKETLCTRLHVHRTQARAPPCRLFLLLADLIIVMPGAFMGTSTMLCCACGGAVGSLFPM